MSKIKEFNEDDLIAMALEEIENDILEDDEEDSILDSQIDDADTKAGAKDRKKVVCKICLETGIWYSHGSFPNGTKKWVEESGLICNGRMCGKCNVSRSKGTMRRIRGERAGDIDKKV